MYFDEEEWARIQARARASGRSAASVVRDAVTAYLTDEKDDSDPILAMIGEAKRKDRGRRATDSSVNHDHYLYGWPKAEG